MRHTIRPSNVLAALGTGALLALATVTALRLEQGEAMGGGALAAGGEHTCALTASGGVKCWGRNDFGQLGDGTTTNRPFPVDVPGLTSDVSAVSAGQDHTCALTTGGGVKCWGRNLEGQLGNGTTTDSSVPVDVSGLTSGVAAIAAGGLHTCAVTTTGGARCWGFNFHGQLGDGTFTSSTTPVNVSGLGSGVAGIAAGGIHTCAQTTTGAAKCWGNNANGQLGDGTTLPGGTPKDVSGLASGVSDIAAGFAHTCAVAGGGAVRCWGWNDNGQLGDGTTTTRLTPVAVSGLGSGGAEVAAGGTHTCVRTSGGGAKCWGANNAGQLGNGTTTGSPTPVDVSGLGSGVSAIATGSAHSCALVSGLLQCWGNNSVGQVGDATSGNIRTVPITVLIVGPTPTPTTAPTSTPKNPNADTDGDTIANGVDPDDDNDGCADVAELGTDPTTGGLRSPHNIWDVFDTRTENGLGAGAAFTGAVDLEDVLDVAAHFGQIGDPSINPLSDASGAGYHTRFERTDDPTSGEPWDLIAPTGSVGLGDMLMAAAQFGHTCP